MSSFVDTDNASAAQKLLVRRVRQFKLDRQREKIKRMRETLRPLLT